MLKKTVILALMFIASSSFAQLNNSMLTYDYSIEEADSNTLWFGVRAFGFNKNNEYFNKITDGLTLFGYQINPYISYHAGKHFRFDAGIYLRQDFGTDSLTRVQPTISIKYLEGNHCVIFGALENSYNHNLIEPLYNFEKGLVDRQEYGLQALFDQKKWWMDVWISWEKMIYRGDAEQEEVTGGLSWIYKLKESDKGTVSIPVQLVVYHRGGQIDNNPNPIATLTNSTVGLKYERFLSGWLKQWSFEGYYVGHKDFSFEPDTYFSGSDAVYLNAGFQAKNGFEVLASYWRGKGYFPIMGGELYSSESFSYRNLGHNEANRNVFILRFFLNKTISPGLNISTRFEPHYDFGNSKFEFSHGLYLSVNPEFFITRIKKVKY